MDFNGDGESSGAILQRIKDVITGNADRIREIEFRGIERSGLKILLNGMPDSSLVVGSVNIPWSNLRESNPYQSRSTAFAVARPQGFSPSLALKMTRSVR